MTLRHPLRVLLLAALAFGTLAPVADARWTYNPRSNVPFHTAVMDALLVAMQKPDRFLVRMAGESMLPFFGPESLAVVQPVPVERLRVGMVAVYQNPWGEKVAHRIIAATDAGWRVQGFNNDRPDSTLVTAANLLGVIYATFNTAGLPSLGDGMMLAGLPSLDVVLGAPAK